MVATNLAYTAAPPALTINVQSVSVNAGDPSATLEVTLTNPGPGAVVVGGFSFGLTAGTADLSFTGATNGTTTALYIFDGLGLFGPGIAVQPPNLPGQALNAEDILSLTGSLLAVGDTVGLGHVTFKVTNNIATQDIPVTLSTTVSSVSDQNGNAIPYMISNGMVHVTGGCHVKVLIAYADGVGAPTAIQSAIQAQPGVIGVDLFDAGAGTPTLAQLQQYNLVFAFSNSPGWNDAVAMGNVLADYEDGGGAVIVGTFAFFNGPTLLQGRWMTGGYSPFNPSGTNNLTSDTATITAPNHPLMQGVTTLTSGFRTQVTLASGASSTAMWPSDNSPAVGYIANNGHTAVALNAYLGAADSFSGDWARLIVNAGTWINCPPTTGLLATVNDTVTGPGPNQFDYGNSGWSFYNGPTIPSAFMQDEHYAFTTNVIAHFRFHGTQVKIYTVKEPHGGIIGYNLDGMGETTMSNYAPTVMGNMLSYTSPMVADGDHDLVIRVTGTHEMASDSNAITLDKAEVFGTIASQVLAATVNDTVTGNGPNQWDYGQSGWAFYNGANISSAFQGDEHYAFTTNVVAHFRFSGTQVKIYTVKEPHGGIIGYNLDGMGETTVSNYAPTIMGNMLSYTSPMVGDGIHDLVIRVTGTHEMASDSNTITVDKAEVFAPPPQTLTATINDNTTGTGNNQWDYGMTGWFFYNGSNISSAFQGDEHYAFTTNVTGTFRFTGTQVKIYTVKESAGGNIGYTLDANPEVILSNYSPTIMGNTLSFVSPVVANGPHTLVIRVVGTHEPASSGNAITVDKAEVYGP
jgi:hypothetical protein